MNNQTLRGPLTSSRLRELIHYDDESGAFTWRVFRGGRGRSVAGSRAGTLHKVSGYRRICVEREKHYEHRLAFLYMTDAWPQVEVDHRDGKRANNRWKNLRGCTVAENAQNKPATGRGASKLVGASRVKGECKWSAYITASRVRKFLGYFTTPEDAHAAYLTAKSTLHKFQPELRLG